MSQIKVKLAELAKKIGKKAADIAREADLNRNSVSALMRNEVDGIKFDTLEKLCQRYNWTIGDLLEISEEEKSLEYERLYSQESAMIPFFAWTGGKAFNAMPSDFFKYQYGNVYGFFKNDYVSGYYSWTNMEKVARDAYSRYGEGTNVDRFFEIYLGHAALVEKAYLGTRKEEVVKMGKGELLEYVKNFNVVHENFWKYSMFIDCFDVGVDFEEINKIAKRYGLNKEMVAILTTPSQLTFNNERKLALTEIARKIAKRRISKNKLQKFIADFVQENEAVRDYKLKFDYTKSAYDKAGYINNDEIIEELANLLRDPERLERDYNAFAKYEKNQDKKIRETLRAKGLKNNPLYFFNRLSYWREHRKKINMMSFNVLDLILSSLEAKTGIPKKYLAYISFDEIDGALKGLVSLEVLKKRREEGVLVIFNKEGYRMVQGKEADSLKEEMKTRFVDDAVDKLQSRSGKLYRQEGAANLFFSFLPTLMTCQTEKEYFGQGFGKVYLYYKKEYVHVYWNLEEMNEAARYVYSRYEKPKQIDALHEKFSQYADGIEKIYRSIDQKQILKMNAGELNHYCESVTKAYKKFWQFCIFIDSFDPGFDFEKIQEISIKHGFDPKETAILTMSSRMTFVNERKLAILELAKKARNNLPSERIETYLIDFIRKDPAVKKYREDFDYYQSNYAHVNHISDDEIVEEIKKYIFDEKLLCDEYRELKDGEINHKRTVFEVLKRHRLKSNPLYFFSLLTYWRERRKQVNLMSFHILDAVLNALAAKTGISKKYLGFLTVAEVEQAAKGLINIKTLKKRTTEALILEAGKSETYRLIVGKKAEEMHEDLDKKTRESIEDQTIIPGQVASQGYAKGIAKVVLDEKDFTKLKEGEILIAGMTRPEFVPLMKKAAAIVTNEGGITCHAAIVSRELGKPCIIGTKVATKLIKDGDLVEVRANHGTVRILK